MADLASLLADLVAAEDRATTRDDRIRRRFEEATGHPRGVAVWGADGALWWELQSADPRDDAGADTLVAAAVDAYLGAGTAGRTALRGAFAGARYLRWRAGWFAGTARQALERAGTDPAAAGDWLRRGLAAIALEGGIADLRDTIVSLDGLYLAALGAGLDPAEAFDAAARDAGPEASAGEPGGLARVLSGYGAPDRSAALRKAAAARAAASRRGP